MTTPRSIVIVGGGLAGATAAFALREHGYDGALSLVGAESHLPYERPPLSKDYLRGTKRIETFRVEPREAYAQQEITLELGRRAVALDRTRRVVVLDNERALPFDRLLLATGSVPRRLGVAGEHLAGVHSLRNLEDADLIARESADAEHVAVVGGGWIGSEVAASLREMGRDVTLVSRSELPLGRFLGREIASVYADLHRQHGIRQVTGRVESFTGRNHVEGVRLTGGDIVPAQLVVVGVGAAPDLGLADGAGLRTALGGIAVDAQLRSRDREIFAAGDIAAATHPAYGRRLRVEHWDNAREQGKIAARNMLGEALPYARRPYFYSDQFDLGMEYRGVAVDVDDVVVSGDLEARAFCAFWLHEGRVVAAMNANVWDAGDRLQALVERGPTLDRETLRAEGANLKVPVGA